MGSSGPQTPSGTGATRRASRLFGRPWWQGVGAIISTVGVLVGVLIYVLQRGDEKKADTPSTNQVGNNNNQIGSNNKINDSCIAQGQNASANCIYPPAPKSLGRVTFQYDGFVKFLFAGPASELPTPPDYPESERLSHCDDWGEWISQQPRIHAIAPKVLMDMISGASDLVVVNRIDPQIFRRTRVPSEVVLIECKYGAGSNAGVIVNVDVGTNVTEFFRQGEDAAAPLKMPPAALTIKGSDYDGASIDIRSTQGFLYEGMVAIKAIINDKTETYSIGSPSRPFRWLGGDGYDDPIVEQTPAYDWDIVKRKWVQATGA